MNPKTTTAVIVVLVTAAILYETYRTRETNASLAALAKERDSLSRQVQSLNRAVAETKALVAAPLPVETPRPAQPVVPPVAPVADVPVPGISTVAPAGWSKNGSKPGSYVVGVDRLQMFGGQPSAYVKSNDSAGADGFGGMMQMASAENLLGKRVRMTGWVKSEDADDGGGHLWLRVDGKQTSGGSLQFDNMDNRPIKGTTDWQQYSVVLDVPNEAAALAYGFFVSGKGKMWVSGTKIEEVGADVPSTNMIKAPRALPKGPVNLNFE